ncbi:DUF4373 domain-containing protein [Enterococcus sp. 2201sp1_2201st1_B8_2201SCRN_220225]|uniref:DUF4373 domain-containing protein n=1 Tax=unclassified Enterococcus TaxID=2608891 RepID=UPI0034A3ACA4
MVRPLKQGLDYFPVDVNFLGDVKVRRVRMACGMEAVGILVYLLSLIYRDHGYYEKWDEELCFLTAMELYLTEDVVEKVVAKAAQVGFFDGELLETQGILTSSGIQARFLAATRKRKVRRLVKEYVVVDLTDEPRIELITSTEKKQVCKKKLDDKLASKTDSYADTPKKSAFQPDFLESQPASTAQIATANSELDQSADLGHPSQKLAESQPQASISEDAFQGKQGLSTGEDQWDLLCAEEPQLKNEQFLTNHSVNFSQVAGTGPEGSGQSAGRVREQSARRKNSQAMENLSPAQRELHFSSENQEDKVRLKERSDREMWLANQREMYLIAPNRFRLDPRFAVSEDELDWIYNRAQ